MISFQLILELEGFLCGASYKYNAQLLKSSFWCRDNLDDGCKHSTDHSWTPDLLFHGGVVDKETADSTTETA